MSQECAAFERCGARNVERVYMCGTCFRQHPLAWPAPDSEPARSLWLAWIHVKDALLVNETSRTPHVVSRVAGFVDQALDHADVDADLAKIVDAIESAEDAVEGVEWNAASLSTNDVLAIAQSPEFRAKVDEYAPNVKLSSRARTVYAKTLKMWAQSILKALEKALRPPSH